jgi:hypothetical protein
MLQNNTSLSQRRLREVCGQTWDSADHLHGIPYLHDGIPLADNAANSTAAAAKQDNNDDNDDDEGGIVFLGGFDNGIVFHRFLLNWVADEK